MLIVFDGVHFSSVRASDRASGEILNVDTSRVENDDWRLSPGLTDETVRRTVSPALDFPLPFAQNQAGLGMVRPGGLSKGGRPGRAPARRPARASSPSRAAGELSPELADSVVRYLGTLSGVEGCSLMMRAAGGSLVLASAHGPAALPPPRGRPHPRSVIGRALRTGATTQQDTSRGATEPTLRALQLRWVLAIPLRAGGRAVGVLCLTSRSEGGFLPATLSIGEAMASGLVASLRGINMTELLLRAKVALEKTFDAMPDLVAILDGQGRITRLNQPLADRVGRPLRDLIGQEFAALFPFCADWLARTARRPPAEREDWTEVTDAERGLCYEVKLLDLGVPLPVIGDRALFMRDMTQQREMARRVIAFERRAAAGDLLTGVAHEVRNPLAAIQAAAEALQRPGGADPEAEALLGVIRRQVDRLGALMRDLLHVGRPSSGLAVGEVDLPLLCQNVIRGWPQAEGPPRPVRLLAPAEPLRVRAEEARLEQVLLNLLDNAVHHSTPGSPIRVELARQDGTVRLRVVDEGAGIPAKVLPRVFEPFFTTRAQGTGLGLALVKSILESYGGSVAAFNNDPPPGSTFEIRLPWAGPRP